MVPDFRQESRFKEKNSATLGTLNSRHLTLLFALVTYLMDIEHFIVRSIELFPGLVCLVMSAVLIPLAMKRII